MSAWATCLASPGRRGALAALTVIILLMLGPDRGLSTVLRSVDDGIVDIFRVLTLSGESKWWLIALGVTIPCLFAARRRLRHSRLAALLGWSAWALVFLFAAVALGGITVNVIKVIVGRGRPKLLMQDDFYGFHPFTGSADFHSFPSGHANTLMALAVALGFLVPRWRVILWALGAFLASSRVMVNAHYLSDVIGGSLWAVLLTAWLRARFARWGLVFVRRPNGYALQPAGRFLLGSESLVRRRIQKVHATTAKQPL
ncbi:MAG TPA: phosphatase PAP2 family protein [Azospirillaceae bacterium]|nr:phosphatase PAP2 family protein [Azospirillaceae bacterium]